MAALLISRLSIPWIFLGIRPAACWSVGCWVVFCRRDGALVGSNRRCSSFLIMQEKSKKLRLIMPQDIRHIVGLIDAAAHHKQQV